MFVYLHGFILCLQVLIIIVWYHTGNMDNRSIFEVLVNVLLIFSQHKKKHRTNDRTKLSLFLQSIRFHWVPRKQYECNMQFTQGTSFEKELAPRLIKSFHINNDGFCIHLCNDFSNLSSFSPSRYRMLSNPLISYSFIFFGAYYILKTTWQFLHQWLSCSGVKR